MFNNMDKSIIMNTDKTNSRTIIPVSDYETITKGYSVDYFLYANNYEDKEELEFFSSSKIAKDIFVVGKRKAKGTTNEE
jgi:hypothetical protein